MSGQRALVVLMVLAMMLGGEARPGLRTRCSSVRTRPECLHGSLVTPCGLVCKKGPGEVCGGRHGQYGVCGDGTQCSDCNRCSGCSYTMFRCYSDHDKCASADDSFL